MGYAVYEDLRNDRWAGYGVPAECDMRDCAWMIDRGLGFKCETYTTWRYERDGVTIPAPEVLDEHTQEIEEEHEGCGLFFCSEHEEHALHTGSSPKLDSREWIEHQLTDETWGPWREENPSTVQWMRNRVSGGRS